MGVLIQKILYGAWLWLACLATAFGGPSIHHNYAITRWSSEDGLPQNSIESLCQTDDGYLWVGTRIGLARFDGSRFVNFTRETHPDMVDDCCVSLMQHKSGRLLIGTPTGLMTFYEGRFYAHDLEGRRVRPHGVWKIRPAQDGGAWLCTQIGLYHFDPQTGLLSRSTDYVGYQGFHAWSWEVKDVMEMPNRTMWLGNEDGLSWRPSTDQGFAPMSVPNYGTRLNRLSSFLSIGGDRFLAANVHGLFQFNGSQVERY